jgi:hypothetical protein
MRIFVAGASGVDRDQAAPAAGGRRPSEPPAPPRIHVDDAARLTLPALDVPAGVTMVIGDRGLGGSASPTGGQP